MAYVNGEWIYSESKFSDLVGKTITAFEVSEDKDEIKIACSDGSVYCMNHTQDCCESVSVEDITGDLADLIDSPVLQAEESTNREDPMGKDFYDSFTWTFYRISTAKGLVVLRWLGESNGYYSESVDFTQVK